MILNLVFLIAGLAILLYGANILIDSASALARKFNVPNIVIGLTIIAFGTSAPELAVNIMSAVNGNTELVFGNVIGSNIFNILGILGVTGIFSALLVNKNTTWIEIPLVLLAAVTLFIAGSDTIIDGSAESVISNSEGWLLISFFLIFMGYNISLVIKNKKEGKTEEDSDIPTKSYKTPIAIMLITVGLAMLIGGGKLIVKGASEIASLMGMSERVIGLTIVSIGTSLPELVTSIMAVRKGNVDIAIGNTVGSNIFNSFLVLGISATITPVAVGSAATVDLLVNLLASLLLFIFIFTGKGRKLERWESILFILILVSYMTWLVISQ
ncbi:MAG: calcium/sodium antiporter [Bacteroidales bacterium]